MPVSNKVVSATTAGTLAAALTTIAVWALQQYAGVDLPDAVQGALVVVLTLVCTALAGYCTAERNPAPSAIATVHAKGL